MAVLTALAIAGAVAATAGAVSAYQAGEDQEDALKAQRRAAEKAQADQKALADKEKKAADLKAKDAQQRLLKGATGGGGLLYGSELGVTDDKTDTLGA